MKIFIARSNAGTAGASAPEVLVQQVECAPVLRQERGPAFAADFGSFEVGYIKLASPPAFLLVPMGQAIPPQPQEMTSSLPH